MRNGHLRPERRGFGYVAPPQKALEHSERHVWRWRRVAKIRAEVSLVMGAPNPTGVDPDAQSSGRSLR